MKLSNDTVSILKNFSTINSAIQFHKGDVVTTVSPQFQIFAEAIIDDEFPIDFAIYELHRFINALGLLKEPELNFNESYLRMASGNRSIDYLYTDPGYIRSVPDGAKDNLDVEYEVSFTLSASDFDAVKKAAAVMGSKYLAFIGNGERVSLVTECSDIQDNFVIHLDEETKHTFKLVFEIEHLKMLDGSYDVALASKGLGHFQNQGVQVEYWICANGDESSFEEN